MSKRLWLFASPIWLLMLWAVRPAMANEWSTDQLAKARQFSHQLDTAAVVILQHGELVDQWGAPALPLRCHSVRKSLLSALFGIHVAEGNIDLDATLGDLGIDDNEPSLSDEEKQATVRDLLKARSGVYHPALYETAAMAAKRPQRGSHRPNTFWYYNNWDFNTLGTIFENSTGRSLFEEFEQRIALPLGLKDFRRQRDTQYVAGDDSVHPAYPFQLSARDLAQFGQLMLNRGKWGRRQLIPSAWVDESTASYSETGTSGGYGYMWWVAVDGVHFPGVTLPPGSYSARGYRGQYLVIVPEWDLVVCHRVNSFQAGTSVSKADFGKLLAMIVAAMPTPSTANAADAEEQDRTQFDIVIRNGEIVDGTGKPRFRADVGILRGKIRELGDLSGASSKTTIDATGKIVCPGFIDLHSHAESGLVDQDPARRSAPNLITQGITTVVVNQDGGGAADLERQREQMEQLGVGMNVVQVIGHGRLRRAAMGDDFRRPASPQEIEAMQTQLRFALDRGAFGMSAGLEYVPGIWSRPREMEALSRVIAEYDAVSIVHERSSGSRPMWYLPSQDAAEQPSMLDNLRELIYIADATKATIVATHIKARGVDFWGKSAEMNSLIRQARDNGVSVFADQYAYNTSGSDGRIVLIPDWVYQTRTTDDSDDATLLEAVLADSQRAGDVRRDVSHEINRRGGPDNILIVEHVNPQWQGKSLAEYASDQSIDGVEAAIRLQLTGDRKRQGGARLRAFSMSDDDVDTLAVTPWTATSSDAGIALPQDGPVHPRFYGAFPRKIRRFAIDRELMSLEDAVRVSTSLPASILRLSDRGTIHVMSQADVVVFDPERIRDRADAFDPHQYSEGIDFVLLGGQEVVREGEWLGNLNGSVLNARDRK